MVSASTSEISETAAFEPLVDRHRAARLLGVTTRTLDAWFKRGMGPPRITIGAKKVRYRISSLSAWISSQEVPADQKSKRTSPPSRAGVLGRTG